MVPSGSGNPPRVVPHWDPALSSQVAALATAELAVDAMLIGRLAVYAWIGARGEPRYTKDLDLAVRQRDVVALRAWAVRANYTVRSLPIGGVQVTDTSGDVHIDFIDRTSIEYGNLGPLIESALDTAQQIDLKADVRGQHHWLCPLAALCALKFAAGRPKDEDDLRALVALPECDVPAVRRLIGQHMGPFSLAGFDRFLERSGLSVAAHYADGDS